jgi:hypothetical protein
MEEEIKSWTSMLFSVDTALESKVAELEAKVAAMAKELPVIGATWDSWGFKDLRFKTKEEAKRYHESFSSSFRKEFPLLISKYAPSDQLAWCEFGVSYTSRDGLIPPASGLSGLIAISLDSTRGENNERFYRSRRRPVVGILVEPWIDGSALPNSRGS